MTVVANQVEVPGMSVRRLVARAAFAEIDLAGDPRFDHPLQRAIDGRPADSRRLTTHEIEQIVGAQVTFLLEENPEDLVALAGMLAARGAEPGQIESVALHEWSSHRRWPVA